MWTEDEKQEVLALVRRFDAKMRPPYPGVDPSLISERSAFEQMLWTLTALDSNRQDWVLGEDDSPVVDTWRETWRQELRDAVREVLAEQSTGAHSHGGGT